MKDGLMLNLNLIVLMVFTLWVIMLLFLGVIPTLKARNSDCVKEIAQDFCEEQGYNFSEVKSHTSFGCCNYEREIEGIPFKFFKGEIKECMKK